jgi:uncharacterized protein (TIRG00374 family)
MSQSTGGRWKTVSRWLPGVLISLGAIYALTTIVEWDDLVDAIHTASPLFVLEFLALSLFSYVIRGKAWQTILGKPVNWTQAFFGVGIGYFINDILPFKLGEFARSIYVGRLSGLGTMRTFSSVVIERAFDVSAAAILVLVTLPLVIGAEWAKTAALVALILVMAALVALFLITRHQQQVVVWLTRVSEGRNFLKTRVVPQIESLLKGFGMLTNPSQFVLSYAWIAATWAVWVCGYYLTILQLAPGAPFWWGIFACAIIGLGVALPSAPAGLGVFEATAVAALGLLGLNSSSVLAYAILIHFAQVLLAVGLGIWGLAREKQSLSSLIAGSEEQKAGTIPQA